MKAILSKLFDAIHCFHRLPTFFGLYFALCLISVVRFFKYVKLLWILELQVIADITCYTCPHHVEETT